MVDWSGYFALALPRTELGSLACSGSFPQPFGVLESELS
jgi:hypothetical protein